MDPEQFSAGVQVGQSGVLETGDVCKQGALEVEGQDHADGQYHHHK